MALPQAPDPSETSHIPKDNAHRHAFDNVTRVYAAMDKEMVDLHRKGTQEDNEDLIRESERTAHHILTDAHAPLISRARSHHVLACSIRGDYLWHAREGVRIWQQGMERSNHGEADRRFLDAAKETLAQAEQDYKDQQGEDEEDDDAEDVEDGEDEGGDGQERDE